MDDLNPIEHDGYAARRQARELLHDLRALADVAPPPDLSARVLVRLGLGDAYWRVESPIGPVFVAYNAWGVSTVMRGSDDEAFERAFRERFSRPVHAVARPAPSIARAVHAQLWSDRGPSVRLDLRGVSAFERSVLLKAAEIPRGEVRPYAWIAREIGHGAAVRAVGSALGRNPVPLLIPCHRVVHSDGTLGGYVFGHATKRALLEAEGAMPGELERLARDGVRYWGSDTTGIYCFPSCRHARRIAPEHRVAFRSTDEARAAGYRPCKACRPAVA